MSKAIVLTRHAIEEARQLRADLFSSTIVLGCGAALIMAGRALPF